MSEEFLWVEKYRPSRISDCVLPQSLSDTLTRIADGDTEVPNMIFHGTPGIGKTTAARALCNQRCLDYMVINGSEEGNIDTLRGKIRQFASTISLQGGYKVVILDEADYLNCLDENEAVLLADGKATRLGDLVDGEMYNVLSFNMDTGSFEPDTAFVVNRTEKETYTIDLDNGVSITVTDDHPLIVEDRDGNITERTISQGLDGYKIVLR